MRSMVEGVSIAGIAPSGSRRSPPPPHAGEELWPTNAGLKTIRNREGARE